MSRIYPKDIGEDELVGRLVSKLSMDSSVLIGPGDDCAVVEMGEPGRVQLLKTDSIVEGVHFTPEIAAGRVGWKALARSLSDIAAMAGTPAHALVTLHAPLTCPVDRLEGIYAGINRCAERFGVSVVGGETSCTPGPLSVTISMTGAVVPELCALRSTGEVGDILLVSGVLGGSLDGHHLDFVPRLAQAKWLVENIGVGAMMDLSDGLAKDLPRMAAASQCSYYLNDTLLPIRDGCSVAQALNDGEDYELLIALTPSAAKRALELWPKEFPHIPLTAIGSLHEEMRDDLGGIELEGGFDHFGKEARNWADQEFAPVAELGEIAD